MTKEKWLDRDVKEDGRRQKAADRRRVGCGGHDPSRAQRGGYSSTTQ